MNTKVNQEDTHYKSNKYTGFFFKVFIVLFVLLALQILKQHF